MADLVVASRAVNHRFKDALPSANKRGCRRIWIASPVRSCSNSIYIELNLNVPLFFKAIALLYIFLKTKTHCAIFLKGGIDSMVDTQIGGVDKMSNGKDLKMSAFGAC